MASLPIKVTWAFAAHVVCAALESGIDRKGLPEMKEHVRQMGNSADTAVELASASQEFLKWFEEFVGVEALKEIKGEAPGTTPVEAYVKLVTLLNGLK